MSSKSYFQRIVRHPGLGRERIIRGDDRAYVEAAAQNQVREWDLLWAKKRAADAKRSEKDAKRRAIDEGVSEAEVRTIEASDAMKEIQGLLAATLKVCDRIDWNSLKQLKSFSQPRPVERPYLPLPVEPMEGDDRFKPQLGLMDKLWSGGIQKKQEAAKRLFATEHAAWSRRIAETVATNDSIYGRNCRELEDWEIRSSAFESARHDHNAAVDRRRAAYEALQSEAICDYCELVLSESKYPECCPKQFDVGYHTGSRTLLVDYDLPAPSDLPKITEVKFSKTKNDFSDVELTKKQFESLYGDVLCQVALRTIHELFEADVVGGLRSIVLNGFVTALDPSSGHSLRRCVLSVKANSESFKMVNLMNVDPVACVKGMGGLAGAKLIELKPVLPLQGIDRTGDRFSAAEDIGDGGDLAFDEWSGIAKTIVDLTDVHFIKVGTLVSILGLPIPAKFSAKECRDLAVAVESRGLGIEPDPRHGGRPYLVADEIALFRPSGGSLTQSYPGAASLLQLCVMIAVADDQPTEAELNVGRDFINRSVSLNSCEKQRLSVLERLLCREPELSKRSLSTIANDLSDDQRQLVGEVLVCIAAADGSISSGEWNALDRACKALNLEPNVIRAIFGKFGIDLTDSDEDPAVENTSAPEEAHPTAAYDGFALDMNLVSKITHETSEVVSLLSAVMRDHAGAIHAPALDLSKMPEQYRGIFNRLTHLPSISRNAFDSLSREFKVMPLAAIDAINEWADEHLGDLILEGDEPITINLKLITHRA